MTDEPPGNFFDPPPHAYRTPMPARGVSPNGRERLPVWDAGFDNYVIPPRGWLLGTTFCRRFLSSLLADGGVGKTAVRVAQLMALATGRALTGEHVFQRCRVLILSLEDDEDELRRRVYAVMRHWNVTPDDLRGHLFLAAPKGLRIAETIAGIPAAGALESMLRDTIEEREIDIVALDPFVKSHALEENSNSDVDYVCTLLAKIAIEYNCAIDLPHHTRKGIGLPGDADRGRGGSSMKDAARLVYTLTPMTTAEAEQFNVPETERRALIRMDSGKVNIAPPSAEATWFRIIGVDLDNGDETYPSGDNVQTVERWQPPDTWKDAPPETLNRILDVIDAGMDTGVRYSAATAAVNRAAWRVVLQFCPDKPERACRDIIKAWIRTGTLFEEDYMDPTQRKERAGLRVNPLKRPAS